MMLQKSVSIGSTQHAKLKIKVLQEQYPVFISMYPKSDHSNAFSPPPLPTLEKFSGDQNYGIIFLSPQTTMNYCTQ